MRDRFRYGRVSGIPYRLWVKSSDNRRRLWQRLDNPSGQSRPVFLVGCGRSGTNMVTKQLSTTWQIDLYNEDNPAAFKNWRFRELATIEELINRGYSRITLFKPILETHLARMLLDRFPEASVIFSFRHVDDVVNSALRHFGEGNWPNRVKAWINEDFAEFASDSPPEKTKDAVRSRWRPGLTPESATALYWIFYNRLYFDLGLHDDNRVMLVQYEASVLTHEREFVRLCRFLDIRYSAQMTEGIFSSSIRLSEPPRFNEQIRMDCEVLWQRMCRASPNAEMM